MSLSEFLAELNACGVRLWLEQGALRYSAPAPGLSHDQHSKLAAAKSEICELIRKTSVHAASATGRAPRTKSETTPLTLEQQRIWRSARIDPASAAFNICGQAELAGPLNVPALQQALREIVRRHDILRSRIVGPDDRCALAVAADSAIPLPLVDLTGIGDADSAVTRMRAAEGRRLFDLRQGPLLRVTLVRRSDRHHVLILTVHHLIFDHWSVQVLAREMHALYAAYSRGQISALTELREQFSQYALAELERVNGSGFDPGLEFWKRQLHGLRPTEFPAHPRMCREEDRSAAWVHEDLSGEVLARLRAVARSREVGLPVVLMTALFALLRQYIDQDDIAVGTTIIQRAHPDFEPLIGLLINTVILRCDVTHDPTLGELLTRMKRSWNDSVAHSDVPFQLVLDRLRPGQPGRLFNVGVEIRLAAADAIESAAGLIVTAVESHFVAPVRDLTLFLEEAADHLTVRLEYRRAAFATETIRQLSRRLTHLLRAFSQCWSVPISALRIEDELESASNATTRVAEAEIPTIIESVLQQARRTADAIALEAVSPDGETTALTYAALERFVIRLARALYVRIQRETLIAIHFLDPLRCRVAALGVMRAGGAFLVLDPRGSEQQIAHTWSTLPVAAILTERSCVDRIHSALPVWVWEDLCSHPTEDPLRELPALHASSLACVQVLAGPEHEAVASEHRSLALSLQSLRSRVGNEDFARMLSTARWGFESSLFELFMPLMCGGTVVFVEDGLRLSAAIHAAKPTALHAAPGMLDALLQADAMPPSLRAVYVSGDVLYGDTLSLLFSRTAIERVVTCYGRAEAAFFPSCAVVSRPECAGVASAAIAREPLMADVTPLEKVSARAAAFFRSKLGDVDEPTAPFGLLVAHGHGNVLEQACVQLESSIAQRTREQARRLGLSTATLFHAAASLVVAHTSGRDDVVFGTVLQRSPGSVINTLPLRVQLRNLTAQALVERMQGELAELLEHEQVALAVAQRCGIGGSTPLFSTLFNYRHGAQRGHKGLFDASDVRPLAVRNGTSYAITLSIDDPGEGFWLAAQTDRCIDPKRMTAYLSTALGSLVEALERAPQTRALALPILPEQERQQIITLFNATEVTYASEQLVHQMFEQQAEFTPDAVAVLCEKQSLTYGQLNRKANQLARYLRKQGVGPDQLVGICVERSVEMLIGLLGILKAGGAYVPLDPSYPAERLAYMLHDAAPRVVLIQRRLRERLREITGKTVALDDDWSQIADPDVSNLDPRSCGSRSDQLAYVIYTSGSTGEPKGAMNEHKAVSNRLQWMQDQYGLDASDRVLQKTPFSFDVSVWELFWPLMSGAHLIMARPEGHKDPAYLRALIEQTGVTRLHFVPSMLQMFLEQLPMGACPTVRQIVCSGEELSPTLQNKCLRLLPQARLSNLYGPTEAAVDVTFWECHIDERSARVPIGRPIANLRMYVLDRYSQPVPIGVAGEIHIGGAGVGRGYLNRPELTAERFVRDPFSSDPRGRMYKTGDLGRWRADGTIEYLGRNDDQVKVRGYRIELGEIESQLLRHEQVREAVVLARAEGAGEKRLVAYVTSASRKAPSVDELRMHLKDKLPEYMRPAAYVVMETLPLTPNGKVDKKSLPRLGALLQQRGREAVPSIASIGRPLDGVGIQLLRRGLDPAPVGMVGQIAIAGPLLARGYVRRPDLTAARFQPDPATAVPGARRYLTGDRGCVGRDGSLYCLGGLGEVTSLHGRHIDLLEIEAVLRTHIRVRAVAASIATDASGQQALQAHVVLVSDEQFDIEADLRDHVARTLPPHMVPELIVRVHALPLKDGKLDRTALPSVISRQMRSAQTQTERTLTRIWEEVLHATPVNLERSFFDLGGDSVNLLAAARLTSERLGLQVTATDMLRYVSIRSLAHHLDSRGEHRSEGASLVQQRAGARLKAMQSTAARARGARS